MKQNYVLQKVRLYHLFHFSYSALGSIILDAYIPKSVFNVHIVLVLNIYIVECMV